MNLTKEQRKKLLRETIRVIESSSTIPEATEKLGLKAPAALYARLKRAGYKVVRSNRLKVVKDVLDS
jgi:hypothetical protein